MVDRPKPYTSRDLIDIAVNHKAIDPLRVIATYADQGNWYHVDNEQRHHWAWGGPVIVGWELADTVFRRHVAPPEPVVLTQSEWDDLYFQLRENEMNPTGVIRWFRDNGFEIVRTGGAANG